MLPKVSRFIGEAKKPSPLPEKDIEIILEKINNREAPKPKINFEDGETVRIVDGLKGRTVVNLFFEDSTRTRSSFELAAKWLSADAINVSARGSSVSKDESMRDTLMTLDAMGVDAIVMRHPGSGSVTQAARQWHPLTVAPSSAFRDLRRKGGHLRFCDYRA